MHGFKAALCGIIITLCACGCNRSAAANVQDAQTALSSTEDTKAWNSKDGYIRKSESVTTTEESSLQNTEYSLSVPTYVTKIDDMWYIVDCYHDQIIYNENMGAPLYEWKVLTKSAKQPHTMAGDGRVILVDDTENNRVLVFEKKDGTYVNTQMFEDIGKRPHYTVYDKEDKAFYVWSSTTGEMYIFRHDEDSSQMYLCEIRSANENNEHPLEGTYIRSFYIDGDDIYFVSGIGADGRPSGILVCDKKTLLIREKIEVPSGIAGMAALCKAGSYFYITVSTDINGDQNAATMIRTKDLRGLAKGDYEEIYSKYFVGGGTPYNITQIDDTYYLTEHRLPGHSVWSFKIENDEIKDARAVY